jgi:hypothetical protein
MPVAKIAKEPRETYLNKILSLIGRSPSSIPEEQQLVPSGPFNEFMNRIHSAGEAPIKALIGGGAEGDIMNLVAPMMMVGKGAANWATLPRKFSNIADKMERAEISDAGAKMKFTPIESPTEWLKLGDVLDHTELFNAYPKFRDMPVRMNRKQSHYNPEWNAIEIADSDPGKLSSDRGEFWNLTTLLHEIQHAIQEKEGFARGGSVEGMMYRQKPYQLTQRFDELTKQEEKLRPLFKPVQQQYFKKADSEGLDVARKWLEEQPIYQEIHKVSQELSDVRGQLHSVQPPNKVQATWDYKRLLGEIEARDTEARRHLNERGREFFAPYASQQIPVEDWIVRKGLIGGK